MNHKDLDCWKESMKLVKEIYSFLKDFPDEERFGITSQIRRSLVSIPCNIAEGASRKSDKEFIQFLYISLGSISELETLIIISNELNYIENSEMIRKQIEVIRKLIIGLIKYLKNK